MLKGKPMSSESNKCMIHKNPYTDFSFVLVQPEEIVRKPAAFSCAVILVIVSQRRVV